jgi:TrmH family RNA methyltransferase
MSDFIDHLGHPLALDIQALLTREGRISSQQMIIDDEENMLQALRAGIVLRHVFATDPLSDALRLQLSATMPVSELSKRTSKKLFGGEKMSRVFAIADIPREPSRDTLAALTNDILVLDHISISGNIGAMLRSSMAFNASAVVLLDADPVDTYDRRVIRASRGYIFALPVVHMSTEACIDYCRAQQIHLVATSAQAPRTLDEAINDPQRWAIILGSETEGCSTVLTEAADTAIRIPVNPRVESLNVSVAASLILYLRASHRQRNFELR